MIQKGEEGSAWLGSDVAAGSLALGLHEAAQQAVARQERQRGQRQQVAHCVEHRQLQPQHAVQPQGRCREHHIRQKIVSKITSKLVTPH